MDDADHDKNSSVLCVCSTQIERSYQGGSRENTVLRKHKGELWVGERGYILWKGR